MIGCILTAVCLSFCAASCSSDDDEPKGGSANNYGKLGDKTFNTPYGFWYLNEEIGETGNNVTMEFFSYNPTSEIPQSASFVAIEYTLPEGEKEINSTVIKGGKYHIYVAVGVSMSDEGLQCETIDNDTNNPDLKIERNGNSYKVSIDNVALEDDYKSYNFSFNFSGQLKHQFIGEM